MLVDSLLFNVLQCVSNIMFYCSYSYVKMPEVKRLKEMNDQMKRELGVEREKVSVSAARYNTVVYRCTCT